MKKKIITILMLGIMASSTVGSTIKAKEYQSYENEYSICPELLEAMSEYDSNFNVKTDTKVLANLFEKYEELYDVLIIYELGEKEGIRVLEEYGATSFVENVSNRSMELERLHGKA